MKKYINLKKAIFKNIGYLLDKREVLHSLEEYVSKIKFISDYAVYGVAFPEINLGFQAKNSCLSGSYFLGKIEVLNSIIINSDLRGDELKRAGDVYQKGELEVPLCQDEKLLVQDSLFVDTLVHNCSHDLENLEVLLIKNTISLNWANIHGTSTRFSLILPLATVDLSIVSRSVVGEFSYVQGDLQGEIVEPGTILIKGAEFLFKYRHGDNLKHYVCFAENSLKGEIIDFLEGKREAFKNVFNTIPEEKSIAQGSFASPYAVYKGKVEVGENVLISQKAYLEDVFLGKGANAQENCYIINSYLSGYNVSAHGSKIINTFLEENVFVGFNSYLKAKDKYGLKIGKGSVVMPHTIIDVDKELEIPAGTVVWGIIRGKSDLTENSLSLEEFKKIKGKYSLGNLEFEGDGERFISAFAHRIEHILEANGAFFDGKKGRGHAQNTQKTSFHLLSSYTKGDYKGIMSDINLS
jgi:carbonic anhydrase/acetyltransferase-like protein (isoleucine patch superfamily)